MIKISRANVRHLIITVLQWYVATILIIYGVSKMAGKQFGILPAMASRSITGLDKFYVMWYLFGDSPLFSITVGLIQVIGSILLIIPRTRLIGALVLLPVIATILLLDVCFSRGVFGWELSFTVAGLMIADLIILYDSRRGLYEAFTTFTLTQTPAKRMWLLYPILPGIAFLLNYAVMCISWPVEHGARLLYDWFHRL